MPPARSIWAGASALNPVPAQNHAFITATCTLTTATLTQQGKSQTDLA